MLTFFLALIFVVGAANDKPYYFTQLVDHFRATSETYEQRYYFSDDNFAGPGHPIFCIMGGEAPIAPEVGLFYPFVYEVMAARFKALVIEPEHRFYGTSQPFAGDQPFSAEHLQLLTPQQALADAAHFIVAMQAKYNCTARGTPGYCPVVTVGGSYPGFLSAMMRLRYPGVVDVGYAASAPMLYYSYEAKDQYRYYQIISDSAEKAVSGCKATVREALSALLVLDPRDIAATLNICKPLPDYLEGDDKMLLSELLQVIRTEFASLNMQNYPPGPATGLSQACTALQHANTPLEGLRELLSGITRNGAGRAVFSPSVLPGVGACFEIATQIPDGAHGTVACGDWSGCGGGAGGHMWDYQTCTFLVETIGTNNITDMFPAREFTMQWLDQHCATRFNTRPDPQALVSLWGFDRLAEMGASKIIFSNGLNDGWSAAGIQTNLSDTLIAVNMPSGAHHSDLTHVPAGPDDTPDVVTARAHISDLIALWLSQV